MSFVTSKHFINISSNLSVGGKGSFYENMKKIAILIFYLQFVSATTKWISNAEDKAQEPAEALAIYSNSDNSFIRTWKEQNHLKVDASHLLFSLLNSYKVVAR